MFEIDQLLLFLALSFVIMIAPGPAILFIFGKTISNGRNVGLVAAFGILVGSLVHAIAASFGLSALLLHSALVFNFVKFIGAIYLIYLGASMILSKRQSSVENASKQTQGALRVFGQGVLVNVLNPKTAIFFVSFLPQFVSSSSSNVTAQMLVLGIIFSFVGAFVNLFVAICANSMVTRADSLASVWLGHWIPGGLLIGVGTHLAISER